MKKLNTKKSVNKKTRINKRKYNTKKKLYGGTKTNPPKVTGNIDIKITSPFLFFQMKPGTHFGENSQGNKVPVFPPYMTVGDFRKFMSSFHTYYKQYNKALKNVDQVLNYEKVKGEIDRMLSGSQGNNTRSNNNKYHIINSINNISNIGRKNITI
jgi:hypothetical protein